MSKSKQGFGRDEMTALLGTGMQDTLARPSGWNAAKTVRNDENDVSTLSVAETAALLKERDAQKQASSRGGARLRAKKSNHVPQHHVLLQEQQFLVQHQEQQQNEPENDDSDHRDFTRGKAGKQREIAEPTILVPRPRAAPEIVTRRRRRDDSSSSSEGDNQPPTRKVRGESSSSEDNSDDDRRRRVLAMRRNNQQFSNEMSSENVELIALEAPEPTEMSPKDTQQKILSSDCSSDSENSSSDSTSSSDEEELQFAKPIFVPKHRRNMIISQEERDKEERDRKERETEREGKRRLSSRMLLAQVIAEASKVKNNTDEVDDEVGGATNEPPDDTDPTDPINRELERDAWEVRELLRLLESEDLRETQEARQREYERRKEMTDQQRFDEDDETGRFKMPGKQRDNRNEEGASSHMQRYYHRGAFYMDDEEWTADDIRHKAKEYERAATGEDKVDKRKLPKIMQVKGFGLARKGTKYKGLSKEDTTDKSVDMLSIARTDKKSK